MPVVSAAGADARLPGAMAEQPDVVQRSASLEEEDKEEYLDEEAWRAKKDAYEAQIVGLEEEQATLRDAWSDIVRANLDTVDDLKRKLKERERVRNDARAQRDALFRSQESHMNLLVAELAAAKLNVAELSDKRDRAHHDLGAMAGGVSGWKSPTKK